MANRIKLPASIESQIMFESHCMCCVCQKRGDHIHHLDGNNSNNIFDNLILLCFDHHDQASVVGSLSKKLSKDTLKKYRQHHYLKVQASRTKELEEYQAKIAETDSNSKTGDNSNHSNLLVRKKFSVLEITEFMGILGFNCFPRKLEAPDDFSLLQTYMEVSAPKFLVFSTEQDHKHTTLARIKSANFSSVKKTSPRELKLGKLFFNTVNQLKVVIDHIKYEIIALGKDNEKMMITSSSQAGIYSGKEVDPLYLLLSTPDYLEIDPTDVHLELMAIDMFFHFLLGDQIKNGIEVSWTYKIMSRNSFPANELKALNKYIPEDYRWVIQGYFDDEEWINVHFFQDKEENIRVLPVYRLTGFESKIKEFAKVNKEFFKKGNIKSAFFSYYMD